MKILELRRTCSGICHSIHCRKDQTEYYQNLSSHITDPEVCWSSHPITINYSIYMKTQKTHKSWSHLEQNGQNSRHHTSWLQTILQTFRNQHSMLLPLKYTYKKWNITRNPEIIPHTYHQLIFDKGAKKHNEEKWVYSINGAGKLVIHIQKNECESPTVKTTICAIPSWGQKCLPPSWHNVAIKELFKYIS